MRRAALLHVALAALVCLLSARSITAQGASPEQGAKPNAPVTTIVGCLEQGHPAAASGERKSETGAINANDYYLRTPTVALPVGGTVAVGKPGTASTATSAGTPAPDSFYRITGLDRAQLRPHAGHRVEMQGHLSASSETTTTAKTTVDSSGRATTRTETHPALAGVLHATAIKMVSASCQ